MSNLSIDHSSIKLSALDLLEQMPCAIGIKDTNSVYVAANTQVAFLTGFKNPKQMIGIQDKDLNCSAAELHDSFVFQDQETLVRARISNLDICRYSDGNLHVFLSKKTKIIDNLENEYILFTMNELPIAMLAKIMNELSYASILKKNKLAMSYKIDFLNQKHMNNFPKEKEISNRQSECLFLLLQGKSIKAIAHALKIHHKTVEEHINHLKEIFDCYSKSQLIEKAFALGLAQIIPPSLLNL